MAYSEKLKTVREWLRAFWQRSRHFDDEMIARLEADLAEAQRQQEISTIGWKESMERNRQRSRELEKLMKEYDEEVISHDIAESDLKEKLLKYETLCHRNEDCPVGGLVQMVRRLRNELDNYRQGKSMYGIMDTIVEADKLLEKYQI